MKTGKYWTRFCKWNFDVLAMFWDMTDLYIKFLKAEWEVNQQDGEEEFKCCMIWQMTMTLLHLNVQLRTEVCRQRERCHKPAVHQKTTDWLTDCCFTNSVTARRGAWWIAPFPGRMLYKATKPDSLSILSLSLGFLNVFVVLLTRATFWVVLFVCSVAWLFWLGCQYQCKSLRKDSERPVLCWWGR